MLHHSINTTQTPCLIEPLTQEIQAQGTRFVKHELSTSERPDLGSAKIVVSGGRGLQNAEKFKLIENNE